MTLAYVFWHWHSSQIDAETYQERLIQFHRTLAANVPEGFLYGRLLREEQASWLGRSETTYEDWNIVENSAALDPLNVGAVNGPCQEPHQQVARWTAGAAGGLYQLRFGSARLPVVRIAFRFGKPVGMTYAELYALLRPLEEQRAGDLWRRQMNLGPGPEFCFHSSQEVELPAILQALKVPVEQIWGGPV